MPFFKSSPIDVLYSDDPVCPQWYRCRFSMLHSKHHVHLNIKLRRQATMRPLREIIDSASFRAHLDIIFWQILMGTAPTRSEDLMDYRNQALTRSMSYGAGEPDSRSPYLCFCLPNLVGQAIRNLSSHELIGLDASAKAVAAQQGERRKRMENPQRKRAA